MGTILIDRPTHWGRKIGEARHIGGLWNPRPKCKDKVIGNPIIEKRIKLLYEYGYPLVDLADWFGISRRTIGKIIVKQGTAIRVGRGHYKISQVDWENKKAEYYYRCAYCGKRTRDLEKDHIVALGSGGEDEPTNIVPACRTCNQSKHNKALLAWPKFKGLQLNLDRVGS